jgi:hypothetical protein
VSNGTPLLVQSWSLYSRSKVGQGIHTLWFYIILSERYLYRTMRQYHPTSTMPGRIRASTNISRAHQNSRRSKQSGARSCASQSTVACITTISGEQPLDPHSRCLSVKGGIRSCDSGCPTQPHTTKSPFSRAFCRSEAYSQADGLAWGVA